MSSAILAEIYDAAKLEEYIRFVEHLGPNVQFHENKWLCVYAILWQNSKASQRSGEVFCGNQPYTRQEDIYRQGICG